MADRRRSRGDEQPRIDGVAVEVPVVQEVRPGVIVEPPAEAEPTSAPPPTLSTQHPAPEHEHIHLPAPTIWPVVFAAGITLLAFGLVTSIVFSLAGILLIARAMAGWIGELRHE